MNQSSPRMVPYRIWFSILAVILFTAFITQIVVAWKNPGVETYEASPYDTPLTRVFSISTFFTVWSAGVAAFAALFVALQPDGETAAIRTLWVTAVMMTTLTAVIYQMYMYMDVPQLGIYSLVNTLMHRVVPALTVGTFLVAGPRGWINPGTIGKAFIIPSLWLLYTIGAGHFAHAYPYIFMNPAFMGVQEVAKILGQLALFGVGLGFTYLLYDKTVTYVGRKLKPKPKPKPKHPTSENITNG